METLSNDKLSIKVKKTGAELASIVRNDNGHQYLWQADPAFWKRHSPVLFPIVGGLWDGQYRYKGKTYSMSQHGFARDQEFELIHQTQTEIRYRLLSDDKSLEIYPFDFSLEIGYKLSGNSIEVIWEVTNTSQEDMYFQIGAHPAFNYPNSGTQDNVKGFFGFDTAKTLNYILISEKGCVDVNKKYTLELNDGLLPIDKHTFDNDALIFENSQIKKVTLFDSRSNPYISLQFDAPLVGLWEPPHKNSPFVCIEPWYGRCDRAHFSENFEDKDWMNKLSAGEQFAASYKIIIE